MPACYVSPELLALAEIEAEQFGGISPATRKLWENYLRSRGHALPEDSDRAERYQRRVAELRSEVRQSVRQPMKAEPVWE
jgi:hypothetical protein